MIHRVTCPDGARQAEWRPAASSTVSASSSGAYLPASHRSGGTTDGDLHPSLSSARSQRPHRCRYPAGGSSPEGGIQRKPLTGPDAGLPARMAHRAAAVPLAVRQLAERPGRPLADWSRLGMEHRLGGDFRGVTIHEGPDAERASRIIGARAFTVGRTVVLGRQESGATRARTLAHELTHVQQSNESSPLRVPFALAPAATAIEQEADRRADTAINPNASKPSAVEHVVLPGTILRQVAEDPEDAVATPAGGDLSAMADQQSVPDVTVGFQPVAGPASPGGAALGPATAALIGGGNSFTLDVTTKGVELEQPAMPFFEFTGSCLTA